VQLRDLISVNILSKIAWNHSTSVCVSLSATACRLQNWLSVTLQNPRPQLAGTWRTSRGWMRQCY